MSSSTEFGDWIDGMLERAGIPLDALDDPGPPKPAPAAAPPKPAAPPAPPRVLNRFEEEAVCASATTAALKKLGIDPSSL